MGKRFDSIGDSHRDFIGRQKVFFVGTAAPDGRVNVSPKGMDSLRVLDANRVVWLNYTGSGNETAAHLRECDRMTIMFCALEGSPLILRLYGRARAVHPRDDDWASLANLMPVGEGARQFFDMRVDLVQTSCGFGAPLYEYKGERGALEAWAAKKGREGIEAYWAEKNRTSIDGRDTGIAR